MPIVEIQELVASAKPRRAVAINLSAHYSGRRLLRPFSNGLKQSRREIVQFVESVGNNFRKLRRDKL